MLFPNIKGLPEILKDGMTCVINQHCKTLTLRKEEEKTVFLSTTLPWVSFQTMT